jgi:hypothetical protein
MSDSLEPKLRIKELKEQRTTIITGEDGRDYQSELPGSWSNARIAAADTERVCRECRDSPHFDTQAHYKNRELAQRIQQAFDELKPGKGFVLAWRLYAEKDHPRWKVADGCGCGCGCFSAQESKPARKVRGSKSTRNVRKPSRARQHED